MDLTYKLSTIVDGATEFCKQWRHEFLMPEHVLYIILKKRWVHDVCSILSIDEDPLIIDMENYFLEVETVPMGHDYEVTPSCQYEELISLAARNARATDGDEIDVPHIMAAMFALENSMANYFARKLVGESGGQFMQILTFYNDADSIAGDDLDDDQADDEATIRNMPKPWCQLVTCLNDVYKGHNPLIGRDAELERTIQVLCRKDRNNPLHVGEPGVGKTALVYGLTARIERGEVPERLRGSQVYMMDMASMVAGTQFRGDFEKRMKDVMEGLAEETGAILYIDEIHNLVGAGRTDNGALDASNMIKPYLEDGSIRFIGSTTYDEYNRHIAQHKSLVRRFQQIDIAEPSVDDAIAILRGLIPGYETFHGVRYSTDAAEYAVRSTARYVNDRFLPDKAIDLIDEAGAYRETHPQKRQKRQTVDRRLLSDVLGKMCKIDAQALKTESNDALLTLAGDIKAQIYGQDVAVDKVVEAVQLAKAGLADDTKPMASLLFVGPTGVGKTEVARVLAEKLGVSLVRFDMSEYAEKHAVAKLIGSPAGYVGYEDGGLLTAAIRKSPNCVLLFDEIEKAHADIYDIFLQIMDYASLTDNRGQRADFRNVVIIMTSNAGAQYASRANIGFAGGVSRGEAMLEQVKKTFKPEFVNRLTDIVVFNDMNDHMASLILDKCLRRLADKLRAKHVTMSVDNEARAMLLARGLTKEYGAREIERVVGSLLKPLLMREILFGSLRKGGEAVVTKDGDKLMVRTT